MHRSRSRSVVATLVVVALTLVVGELPTRAEGSGGSPAFSGLQARLAVGSAHACTVADSGRVACWGDGDSGRLGYGNVNDIGDTEKPAANPVDDGYVVTYGGFGGYNAIAVAAGYSHTCVVLRDGAVQCWGDNSFGQLGRGHVIDIGDNEKPGDNLALTGPVELPGSLAAIDVGVGREFSCALLVDGSVSCWGNAVNGQLGYGNLTAIGDNESPDENPVNGGRVPLPGGRRAEKITVGNAFVCALLDDGTITCWGDGASGRLGYGNTNDIGDNETPAANPVNGGIVKVVAVGNGDIVGIDAGGDAVCAVSRHGYVYCWGDALYGALGYGNINDIGDNETPSQNPVNTGTVWLPGGQLADAVSVGANHTCAILRTGNVACWGRGLFGRLGYGNTTAIGDTEQPKDNPVNGGIVALPGGETATAVSAGEESTCVILRAGRLACWGEATSGVLGYGNINDIGDTETPAANPVDGGRLSLPGGQLATQLFVPLPPARLLDTRPGQATADGSFAQGGVVAGGQEIALTVTGRAGVPTDAAAVSLNVTVTAPALNGYVTSYPCGSPRPTASNLNFSSGQTIANNVISKVGTGGKVCLYTSVTTHLVADVGGYFPATSTYAPLNPARLLDTRPGQITVDGQFQAIGANAGGQHIQLQVAGRGGAPNAPVPFALNVTATDGAADGFVTVYPCTSPRPTASNLNYRAGDTVANSVIVRGPIVCVYTSTTVHLVVDVQGSFAATNAFYQAQTPARLVDSRPGAAAGSDPFTGAGPLVGGTSVVLATVPPQSAIVLNVTVTEPIASGYLTVYPCGSPVPTASNVNYVVGQTIPNLVIVKVGDGGAVCVYTQTTAQLVVDVLGFFR